MSTASHSAIDAPNKPQTADLSEIPRSPHKIDRATVKMLYLLNKVQPWTEPLQDPLFDLMDLCESSDEQKLLCDLVSRFHYVDIEKLEENLTRISNQIAMIWKLPPENTVIVSTNKSRFSDSSESVLWQLKPKFSAYDGWSTINFFSAMGPAADIVQDGYNVVLVEDFIGTGVSVRKAAEWILKRIKDRGFDCNIYICSIAAMNASRAEFDKLNLDYFVCNWLSRGISDYYTEDALVRATENMQNIESKLCNESEGGKLKDYYFGYKRSEALYHLAAGNTPNNVFPIFWWKWLKTRRARRPLIRRL